MLAYKEYENAQAVEIVLTGRVSTEEFDKVARKLEAFIKRHGQIRVLEVIKDFVGMDAGAFWHDVKFSLRHVQDFSRIAVSPIPTCIISGRASLRPSCAGTSSISLSAK
jgi:SpoIIAA-like